MKKFALLIWLVAGPAWCQNVIPGDQAQRNTSRLVKQIHWTQSLAEAQTQARKEGKLVFWMHMLGSMEGST